MTDMNAFEQKLAAGFKGLMGPSEPVDDVAIFSAITARQAHRWRLQSMFSAAKFVVAAAIMALFGGFLLLATPPTDDAAPAAVSASPSPITTEGLLSGMVTEEVEPGVYRILDDGAGHDLVAEPPAGLTVASDGSVWLLRRSQPPDTGVWADLFEWVDAVVRLGQSGTFPFEPAEPSRADGVADVAVGPDSVAWTKVGVTEPEAGMLGSLDGSTWSHPTWPDGTRDVAAIEATSDGSVWVTQEVRRGPGPRVARIVDGQWTVLPTLEDPVLPGFFHGADRYFAAAPDGTAWLANGDFHRCGQALSPRGLLHFDGTRWEEVDILADGQSWMAGPLALGPDGTLWVYLERPSGCGPSRNSQPGYLARLDAEGWQLFTADADAVQRMVHFGYRDADMAVDADGTLWVGHYRDGVLAFDGRSWRQYLTGMDVNHVGVMPQGSVLATVRSRSEGEPNFRNGSEAGLYVVTPEAVAGTE